MMPERRMFAEERWTGMEFGNWHKILEKQLPP